MVGYDFEDKAYCMELTFNYGLDSYQPGNGLQEFGIFVPDVAAAVKAAKDLNYNVVDDVITGPDQYKFRVFKLPEGRTERFSYVLCRTGDLARRVAFYKDFLGFSDAEIPTIPGLSSKAAAVSYTSATHPHNFEPVTLVFFDDGIVPQTTPWEGRHAFALDAAEVNSIYAKFKAERPGDIMHDDDGEPISLQEKLGTLFIFIAKDPDGYELCLVSRETMLPATIEAVTNYDPKLLSFEVRDKRINAIKEAGKQMEEVLAQHPDEAVFFSTEEGCSVCDVATSSLQNSHGKCFLKQLPAEQHVPAKEYLAAKTNKGSDMPKIFVKGVCIGSGKEIVDMSKSGDLLRLYSKTGGTFMSVPPPPVEDKHFFCNGRHVTEAEHSAHRL